MKNAPFFTDALTSAFGIRKPDRDPPESRSFQPSMWPDFLANEPGRPVRVILIDDDPHIRRVIAGELVSDMRIDMVGQADGLREGRRLVSMCEFDVMIVDLNLGDGSGFDLIEHMKQVRPQAEAIVVSISLMPIVFLRFPSGSSICEAPVSSITSIALSGSFLSLM